jgi:DNA-binding NtrC family response regulator
MNVASTREGTKPLVAVINTTVEIIDMLRDVLEDDDFAVAAANVVAFKQGKQDLTTFFMQHQPKAVIYDVAIPYEENWQFLQEVVVPASGLSERRFVITTTNKRVLEQLVGSTTAIELIGKPFDLETIVTTVRRVIEEVSLS